MVINRKYVWTSMLMGILLSACIGCGKKEIEQNQEIGSDTEFETETVSDLSVDKDDEKLEVSDAQQESVESLEETEAAQTEEAEIALFLPEQLEEETAGTILAEEELAWDALDQYFQIYEVSDPVFDRIRGKSFQENGNISREELCYLKLLHYNYDHEIQVGELMVCADLAEDYREIFQELFQAEYEIYSMYLVDDFWTGDADETDTASMSADNTSCFNDRTVAGSNTMSNHALGRAIDVNPYENPYVTYPNGGIRISPPGSDQFADRNAELPHMIQKGDICETIFRKHGFTWGGSWKTLKDYQHFQKKKERK